MRRFGLGDRWAFHGLHDDGRCFGLSERQLRRCTARPCCIINLHGGTEPRPEHYATDRLVYLETDPVAAADRAPRRASSATIDFLEPHCAFFTFGENYGKPDCGLPVAAPLPASTRPASRW